MESYALGKLSFEDIKNFATLSGIKSLYPSLSKEFINQLKQNELNWFTADKLIEVTLQVDNTVKEYFTRKEILPNQKIVEQNDTHFIINTKVSYDDEILSVVKYWIPYITIVKPLYLKEKLDDVLKV